MRFILAAHVWIRAHYYYYYFFFLPSTWDGEELGALLLLLLLPADRILLLLSLTASSGSPEPLLPPLPPVSMLTEAQYYFNIYLPTPTVSCLFYVTCFNNGVVSLSVYLNVDSVKKNTFCLVSSSTDLRSAAQVSLLVSELRGHISTKSIWKNS